MSKVLRKVETAAKVGLSYPTIWRLMKRGEFPRPVQLSENRVGWLESEIDDFIAERIDARDAGIVKLRQPSGRKREAGAA